MRKIFAGINCLLAGLVFFCIAVAEEKGDFKTKIEDARVLIKTRHLDPSGTNMEKAFKIVQSILEAEPENHDANVQIAFLYLKFGDKTNNNDEKIKFYDLGQTHAKAAMKTDDTDYYAHYWYMANLGRNTQLKGIFNAMGAVGEIRKEMDLLLKMKPDEMLGVNADAMYFLGLPGILGGSQEKAAEKLENGLKVDPNYSLTYISLAKAYKQMGKRKEAKEILEKMLKIENSTNPASFVLDDKPEAESLLLELNK